MIPAHRLHHIRTVSELYKVARTLRRGKIPPRGAIPGWAVFDLKAEVIARLILWYSAEHRSQSSTLLTSTLDDLLHPTQLI
jgi:hypothetical protein